MKMEPCVNLDCYRQSRFLHLIDLPKLFLEIASIEGVTGIDASTESLLCDYPNVPEAFLSGWQTLLSETGLRPVTLSSYIDRLQFRDHIMNVEETADALRRDLYIAKKLGFRNLRIMHDIPLESVEMALPLAEELDICMLDELMPPGTIQPHDGRKGMDCTNDLALIKRTGTNHFGLQVNTGLFQTQPNPTQLLDVLLAKYSNEEAGNRRLSIMEHFASMEFPDFEDWMNQNYPALTTNRELFQRMFGVRLFGNSVIPEDLTAIIPYIREVYMKFIKMYPQPDIPGSFWEPSTPDDEVIRILSAHGYEGPLTSHRMNAPGLSLGANRSEEEILKEELGEVRLHQAHIRRLLNQ